MSRSHTAPVSPETGDYYAILEIDASAEPEVVEAAYRALVRKYHPDVSDAADAEARIRAINAAYAVLRDPARRAAYDAGRARERQRLTPTAPAPFRAGSSSMGSMGSVDVAGDRPVDLFAAALAESWRRAVARLQGAVARAEPPVAAARALAGRWWARLGRRVPPAWARAGMGLVLGLGLVGLIAGTFRTLSPGSTERRALAGYWQVAAPSRASIEAARARYLALVGSPPSYAAAVSNAGFQTVSTQLVAALEAGSARLKSVSPVPKQAESYHLMQLDDWNEQRELYLAYRAAVLSRNQELWTQTAALEAAWRDSPQHEQTEVRAWELAALLAR